MPKTKDYTVSIPKIYRRQYEDIGMFFWVESLRRVVPATPIEQCIQTFFDYAEIDGNVESAMSSYTRLKREFYESAKTDN